MRQTKTIIFAILTLAFLASGTSTSTTKPYIASGPSMAPTIQDGDRMLVDMSNDLEIEREDLVILLVNDKQYVKRVVGVEGDVIEKTTRDSITINDKRYASVIWGNVQLK